MTTKTGTRTIEARIWGVSDHDQGSVAKLYLGQRPSEGVQQFRTRVPLSEGDQATWFQITLDEEDAIVGISTL